MTLVDELIKGLLPENEEKTVAIYAGGFKPPTRGHFEVVKQALEEHPNIDELLIYIGKKERDGITQAQSLLVWEIYANYLPLKVELIPTSTPPIKAVYNYAKNNPETSVLWIIGAREGDDGDFKDIADRTKNVDNYSNIALAVTITTNTASGTAARNAAKISIEKLKPLLPDELKDEEVLQVFDIIKENTAPNHDGKAAPYGSGYKEIDESKLTQGNRITGDFDDRGNFLKNYPELRDPKNQNLIQKFVISVFDEEPSKRKDTKLVSKERLNRPKDDVNRKLQNIVVDKVMFDEMLNLLKKGNYTYGKKLEFIPKGSNSKELRFPSFYLSGRSSSDDDPNQYNQDFIFAHYYQQRLVEGRKPKKDPKKGTGKKPEGSKRRLYTDEDPKDTVGIKFSTRQDIVDTLNKKSFKAKSHARQSQIINLIHQRVRAALGRTKDPAKKKKLRSGFEYIKKRKEASKAKTQRLKKLKESKIPSGWERRVTIPGPVPPAFLEGDVLTYEGYKKRRGNVTGKLAPQRDYPVEVIEVKWNEDKKEYVYKVMLLRDLGYGEKRGMKVPGKSEKEIKDKLADKQLTRAEFERQPTNRKDSFDKPIKLPKAGSPFGWYGESKLKEGDTYEKMAAKGKKVNEKKGFGKSGYRYRSIYKKNGKFYFMQDNPFSPGIRQEFGPYKTKAAALRKMGSFPPGTSYRDITENASYSNDIDFKRKIVQLTKHMIDKGMNIQPLPKVEFVNGDSENARDFFGKTAYYTPDTQTIVLYTEGRHPKDIVRSFAHEMIHHIQYLENRLGNINTTDTTEDEHLDKLEREANLRGTMTFRNWTDSIVNEGYEINAPEAENAEASFIDEDKPKVKDPFGLNAYARELATLREDEDKYYIYLDMDGVVADFDNRFKDLSGMMPQEYVDKYGKNDFWDLIDEKHKVSFWRGIEIMPGAKKLVNYVSQYPYEMLTAPSVKKQSVIGKSLWVKDKVGTLYPSKPKVTYRSAKQKHTVKPKLTKFDILIDDKGSTIDRWDAAGGTAIFYQNADQVINDLKKLGL